MSQAHDTFDAHETLSQDEAHSEHHHVTPFWTMFWVFAVLLFLTALTVWTSRIPMSETAHIIMAIVIAVVKSALVFGFFMHLLYDRAMNTVVVIATLFGVVLFIGLTVIDIKSRGLIEKMEAGEVRKGGTLQNYAGSLTFPLTGNEVQKADKSITELAKENAAAAAATKPGADAGHGTEAKPADPKPH
ncbi:MAG: cytochrome C oxidase subunit IV family protein [Phycisphaerales bacterium]